MTRTMEPNLKFSATSIKFNILLLDEFSELWPSDIMIGNEERGKHAIYIFQIMSIWGWTKNTMYPPNFIPLSFMHTYRLYCQPFFAVRWHHVTEFWSVDVGGIGVHHF